MNKNLYNIVDLFERREAPVFIIAELSANHNGDMELARKTICAMAESGADAVKVQTFHPDSMTLDSDQTWFQTRPGTLWEGRSLYDLYREAELPWEWHEELMELANSLGMLFFSSPFDHAAVQFLEELQVPLYKIASPEITDIPLLQAVGATGKPVILSTGIANEEDIELALGTLRACGTEQIAVLKCTTAYPSPYDEINLRVIPLLRERYDVIPGLSDHTLGTSIPIAAVAMGAQIIEKHFILDKSNGGVDEAFSLEPNEYIQMVGAVREVELALGKADFALTPTAEKSRSARRSIFAIKNIAKGDFFTDSNVKVLRPGLGLHPKHYFSILGTEAQLNISRGTPLESEHVKLEIVCE